VQVVTHSLFSPLCVPDAISRLLTELVQTVSSVLHAWRSHGCLFQVCTATLVEALLGLNSSTEQGQGSEAHAVAKALRCVEAEHVYAGVPCGVMDQFASAAGLADNLLLIDCRSDTATHVPFLDGDVSIVVCNSNVKHSLDGSEYPTRVKQVRAKKCCFGGCGTLGFFLSLASSLELQ
jgi:hypothetical protein